MAIRRRRLKTAAKAKARSKPAPRRKASARSTVKKVKPAVTRAASAAPELADHALRGAWTVIYPAPNLTDAKAFFTRLLEKPPYFDQPFYVGFNVNGYELGLDPDM